MAKRKADVQDANGQGTWSILTHWMGSRTDKAWELIDPSGGELHGGKEIMEADEEFCWDDRVSAAHLARMLDPAASWVSQSSQGVVSKAVGEVSFLEVATLREKRDPGIAVVAAFARAMNDINAAEHAFCSLAEGTIDAVTSASAKKQMLKGNIVGFVIPLDVSKDVYCLFVVTVRKQQHGYPKPYSGMLS
jgi:hypothetical protein